MLPRQRRPEHVQVKRTNAGLGLFTTVPIRKGETVLEYVGERIPTHIGDERDNRYIFNVSKRFDIDGSGRYNTARYANHSCRPNCEAINRRGRIFIVARKQIVPGEEITYDYGRDHFEGYIKPHGCKCQKCLE